MRQCSLVHGTRLELGVELTAKKPGMVLEFDNFHQRIVRGRTAENHGEGKLVARDADCLRRLEAENLIALQYADPATGKPTQEYPLNPNGSSLAIAGLTDPTGRVLGLMPHPEAFHHVTNHPGWTRGELDAPGTLIFVNAVRYLRGQS